MAEEMLSVPILKLNLTFHCSASSATSHSCGPVAHVQLQHLQTNLPEEEYLLLWLDCVLCAQEPSQADSMPAAVNKMITGLIFAGHFVLHDERIYDQAYYGHLMLLFKASSYPLFKACSQP